MIKKIIFNISSMTCVACAISNEKELKKNQGIIKANVNFASKKALVEYNDTLIQLKDIKTIIQNNGYKLLQMIIRLITTYPAAKKFKKASVLFFGQPF